MDLHPGVYEDDAEWQEFVDWYNKWIGALPLIPDAQPYNMYVDLGFHSFNIVFDADGNPSIGSGSWFGSD